MATWEPVSYYYSGQGVVLIGDRNPITGKGENFLPVGNVSDLKVGIATSVIEHKESTSGARGIDLRLTTEIKGSLAMTIENFNAKNLANALRGSSVNNAAATVTDEALKIYFGKVAALAYPNLSAMTSVTSGSGTPLALTAYVDDDTPWDYKVNLEAGSILFNDGQGAQPADGLASTANAGATALSTPFVTVGATTTLTFAATPADAVAGAYMMASGLTGADAAFMEGKAFEILSVTGTTAVLNVNTVGKTITGTSGFAQADGGVGAATYNHSGSYEVNALTSASIEKYVRFEGLNTADGNNPVVVEVFRFLADPLRELALIGDNIGQFSLEGNILADSLQSGSKYFKQILLR